MRRLSDEKRIVLFQRNENKIIEVNLYSPEINTRNAQLIFTTHDIWQFSNELLRRDEALAKNYLTGNYGAIPALKPMKMLKGRTADGK